MDEARNAPATKADLAEQGALFKADLAESETRITARFKADLAERETRLVDQLTEVIRDAQTETLKAFYGFVETVQTRFKAQDDTEAGLKKRLTVLEERVLEVEKKLIMPPAA